MLRWRLLFHRNQAPRRHILYLVHPLRVVLALEQAGERGPELLAAETRKAHNGQLSAHRAA